MKQKYTWYAILWKQCTFCLQTKIQKYRIPVTVTPSCERWLRWRLTVLGADHHATVSSKNKQLQPAPYLLSCSIYSAALSENYGVSAPELILTKDNWTPLLYTRATSNSTYNFYIVILLIKLATCDIVQHLKLMKTISNSKGNKVSRKVTH